MYLRAVDLHPANAEYRDQRNLLCSAHLQPSDHEDRQKHEEHVRQGIEDPRCRHRYPAKVVSRKRANLL
jgi:hypothetical protein